MFFQLHHTNYHIMQTMEEVCIPFVCVREVSWSTRLQSQND